MTTLTRQWCSWGFHYIGIWQCIGVWLESDFWRKFSALIFKGWNVQENTLNSEDEDTALPQNVRFHHSLMRRHIPGEQNLHANEI